MGCLRLLPSCFRYSFRLRLVYKQWHDRDMTSSPRARELALRTCVREVEQQVAQLGWDRAPALFSLVPTQTLVDQQVDLAGTHAADLAAILEDSPEHLTAIWQDGLPQADIQDLLNHLVFPEPVQGTVVTMERMVIPPEVEAEAPADAHEREQFFLSHPRRDDIRIACGVLRSGETWCVIRARSVDDDARVAQGSDLVPEIAEALRATLDDIDPDSVISDTEAFGDIDTPNIR